MLGETRFQNTASHLLRALVVGGERDESPAPAVKERPRKIEVPAGGNQSCFVVGLHRRDKVASKKVGQSTRSSRGTAGVKKTNRRGGGDTHRGSETRGKPACTLHPETEARKKNLACPRGRGAIKVKSNPRAESGDERTTSY